MSRLEKPVLTLALYLWPPARVLYACAGRRTFFVFSSCAIVTPCRMGTVMGRHTKSMATKSRPTLLPFELAASFLVPHTASLARTCKRLLLATTSPKQCNAAWIDLFRRRFPCLANLEKFKHPADARKLVKELLAATPSPMWRSLVASGPLSGQPMHGRPRSKGATLASPTLNGVLAVTISTTTAN